jgi:hypothetical protein
MRKFVYEVVDATDDERYYPLGIFLSQKEAVRAVQSLSRTDKAISWIVDESDNNCERIEIRKREIGWSEHGVTVQTIERSEYYDEENDEYKWKKS